MIIIFVIEGRHSNTEINFFKGLAHYTGYLNLKIYPIEKSKKSQTREQEIKGKIKYYMQDNRQDIYDIKFFFIGDGDQKNDFKAMENTKNIIFKYLIENLKLNKDQIKNKILKHTPYKFEDSYRKMANNYFPSHPKKNNHKDIFNIFAKKANWYKEKPNQNSLNFLKIIKDMKKSKNPHIEIIKQIVETIGY